jgi:zinc transport system ATP-binding protein
MDQEAEGFIFTKMNDKSLTVYKDEEIIYEHEGKWLHPLLDFEIYLTEHPEISPSTLALCDKVVGKASAMLTARMGIKKVHAKLLSSLAIPIFEAHAICYTYDQLVEKLPCKTELLLLDITSLDEAHKIIKQRANKTN